jgi:hypothetical protein
MTKRFSGRPWLAPTVPDLLRMGGSEGPKALDAVLAEILRFLRSGRGRYGANGSFDPKAQTYGAPVVAAGPAHRRLRAALYEAILYFQGIAHAVETLDANGVVPRHAQFEMIFDDVQMHRTQQLLNRFYKGEGTGVTLSAFTGWGATNTSRNRIRLRDEVAPVFEHYGLWCLRGDAQGHAMVTAGPLLTAFSMQVLDHVPDINNHNGPEGYNQ